jgi:hypothetical protein
VDPRRRGRVHGGPVVSEVGAAAAAVDARRHGSPGTLSVGQLVRIRRGEHAGARGVIRDVQGFKVVIDVTGVGLQTLSRMSFDVVKVQA